MLSGGRDTNDQPTTLLNEKGYRRLDTPLEKCQWKPMARNSNVKTQWASSLEGPTGPIFAPAWLI